MSTYRLIRTIFMGRKRDGMGRVKVQVLATGSADRIRTLYHTKSASRSISHKLRLYVESRTRSGWHKVSINKLDPNIYTEGSLFYPNSVRRVKVRWVSTKIRSPSGVPLKVAIRQGGSVMDPVTGRWLADHLAYQAGYIPISLVRATLRPRLFRLFGKVKLETRSLPDLIAARQKAKESI